MIGVSETAVRKAVKAGRINRLADGTVDPVAARAAWEAGTDPARTKVRTQARTTPEVRTSGSQRPVPVRTEDEARAAVTLIARILAEEGIADDGRGIDFSKARTAELILKARQRDLDQAEQSRRLVDRAAAEKLFFDTARNLRDAWLSWPARVAIEMADELKVDARVLTQILVAHIHKHLTELGEPEADGLNP
ncbi:hypothetical protein ABC766_12975 [Methylobacterium fujisawaense]|uniref:hypothetical protein n=1 Tax=Methylobacterium fujisawaense TaxID=107400 RepID=UPI0031F4F95E